jgi:hypothetical protein
LGIGLGKGNLGAIGYVITEYPEANVERRLAKK